MTETESHDLADTILADNIIESLPPVRSRRQDRQVWGLFAIVLLVLLLACFALLRGIHAQRAADSARNDVGEANAVAAANRAGVQQLASQVKRLGGVPVIQPSDLPTPGQGAQGVPGPSGPGPTPDQVQTAVALYCGAHAGCAGGPTSAQVAVAVRGYCSTGLCRGSTGIPGASGTPGATGPGPSDDQIAASVLTYCDAHGGCAGATGPTGAAGPTGPSGSSGRGIDSIDCTALLPGQQLVIHYTDGTTQTVDCTLPTPTGSAS